MARRVACSKISIHFTSWRIIFVVHEPGIPHSTYAVRRILLATAAMLALVVLTNPAQSLAQSKATRQKFEVASLKACKAADLPPNRRREGPSGNDPGRTRIVCQTLERLMQWAYVRYANGKPSPRDVAPVPDQPIEGGRPG